MKDFVKLDKKLSLLNLNHQSSKSFLATQQKQQVAGLRGKHLKQSQEL